MHSIREGGRYLARLGRKEVQPCIAGLRQCGISFEEAFDDVEELQRIVDDRQQQQRQQHGMMAVHHHQQQHQHHDTSLVGVGGGSSSVGAGGRQSPTMSHRSSMPGNMSASPNGYSLSGMSNPPPSVSWRSITGIPASGRY